MKRAFTLVELLIVVAIIAILITIAAPTIGHVRNLAVRATCAANLRALGGAVLAYATDNNDMLPTHYADPAAPLDTFLMRLVVVIDGEPREQRVNLGVLDAAPPGLFYCAGQRSPAIVCDSLENPWRGNPLRSAYAARRLLPPEPEIPPVPWSLLHWCEHVVYSDFTAVDDWPGGPALPVPIVAPHGGEGCNRLFGHGSARWKDAQPINDLRPVSAIEPTAAELDAYYELLDMLP